MNRFLHHSVHAGPVLFRQVFGVFLGGAFGYNVNLNPAGSRHSPRASLLASR